MFIFILWRGCIWGVKYTCGAVRLSFTTPVMLQLYTRVRYLFRSSVQRWDSGVCTVQSARLCVWAAGQLPGPPTHHVLLLADWLEPFLETEAAGD